MDRNSSRVFLACIFFGLGILAMPQRLQAQRFDAATLYTKCAFYPQSGICDEVYKTALFDQDNPAAAAVKAEYEGYGRYLENSETPLSDEDLAYLRANGIRIPENLSPVQAGGLHNVIRDPALQKDQTEKNRAITNFMGRAVAADLYCGFNDCGSAGGVNAPGHALTENPPGAVMGSTSKTNSAITPNKLSG